MNKKAEKITFIGNGEAPLLNLTQNEPKVYEDFRTVQENNAPFINEMLQPLWKNKIEGDSVYDKYNNRYYIDNGTLYKNNRPLTNILKYKFVKEDVTEELGDYLAFDVKNNLISYIELTSNNTVIFHRTNGTQTETEQLFVSGEIITSRVRALNDGEIAVVVYKNENDNLRVAIIKDSLLYNQTIIWHSWAINSGITNVTVKRSFPLINICELDNKNFGISLISNYGKSSIIFPDGNAEKADAFTTFLIRNNNIYELGNGFNPSTSTQPSQITTTYNEYFRNNISKSNTQIQKVCLFDSDDNTFYEYVNNAKGDPLDFSDAGYSPIPNDYSVTISGVSYPTYTYFEYTYTITVSFEWAGIDPISSATFTITMGNNTATGTIPTDGTAGSTHVDLNTYKLININDISLDGISITYTATGATSKTVSVPQDYWNGTFYDTATSTDTQNVGSVTKPNVFLDSGEMVAVYSSFWHKVNNQEPWIPNGWQVVETAYLNLSSSPSSYGWTAVESRTLSQSILLLSLSYGFQQNFVTSTQRVGTTSYSEVNPSAGFVVEYNNSNCSDLIFFPGTVNDSSYSYYNNKEYVDGNTDCILCFSPYGYRTRLGDSSFNLLVNTNESGTVSKRGLSFSVNDNDMGTLLTEWDSLDESFYIISDGTNLYYKDLFNHIWKISIADGNELFSIIEDRYIIINTTSYYNCYDSFLNKLTHYAYDYNGRTIAGSTTLGSTANTLNVNQVYFSTAINTNVSNESSVAGDNDRIMSLFIPQGSAKLRCRATDGVSAYKCNVPQNINAVVKGIDVYYSDIGSNYNFYRYSIRTDGIQTTWQKFGLNKTTYLGYKSPLYSPNIFTQYINGIGNKDFIKEGTTCYPLVLFNNQPVLLANVLGEVDNIDSFFVLQGQYYAVTNNKIYSLIYNGNDIDEMDAIVDIKGFRFLGNTPSIAFFWSDKLRAVFSFTGDANMSKLWDGSKFENLYLSTNGRYFYDESTQSIFIPTDQGLLVFGTQNSYLMREYKNISNIQFSDEEFHIMDSGNTYNFKYYNDGNGESEHIKLETSFFGLGDGEVATIDKWAITLYCPDEKWTDIIKLKTVSLTDCLTESEEQSIKITKDMWDKKSNSCLIIYNPKIIKGQGIKLIIDCPYIIQSIIPHIADQGTSTLTAPKKMR